MRSGIVRLSALLSLAITFGACEDPPLGPDEKGASLSARGSLPAPSNLTATATQAGQIDVVWRDNSANEAGFEVHGSATGASGTFSLWTTTGSNIAKTSFTGLGPSERYCHKARAFTVKGTKKTYSAYTNTSCITTPAAPPPPVPPPGPTAPSGLNARPPAGNLSHTVELTWIDNSTDEEGFRVERSAGMEGPWHVVWTADPNNTSAKIYAQPYEQQLCYRVIAFRANAASPSNVDCTYLPNGPTNLTATAVGTAAVDLTWSDNSAFEDGYDIERSETGGNPFTLVATIEGNSTTYRDESVSDNATYWYRVAVKREGGRSGLSQTVSVVIASVPPNAPSETQASANGSSSALIVWVDNSPNELGFRVERSGDSGGTWSTAGTANVNYPAFFDSDLLSDQQYCYRVIAFNGVAESPPSNDDCATLIKGPTDLVGVSVDAHTIEFRWLDNSALEDGYELWFVADKGYYDSEYSYSIALPANTTSYRTSASEPLYYVIARKDEGYSDAAFLYPGEANARLHSQAAPRVQPPASARRTPPETRTR